MNYRFFIIIFIYFLLSNCSINNQNSINKFKFDQKYTNKGFTLVFDDNLFKKKIITKKLDNRSYLILHRNLKKNSNIKITNLINNKSIIAKVKSSSADFPAFFNSVISKRISEDLDLNLDEPYIEISLISNNSSFVAKKTKTWQEERVVAEKAPVDGITINDLNNTTVKKKNDNLKKFLYSIKIADFYYKKSATQMVNRIKSETSIKKVSIVGLTETKFRVFLGPFNDVISLKNSYNKASILEFENLEIIRHD